MYVQVTRTFTTLLKTLHGVCFISQEMEFVTLPCFFFFIQLIFMFFVNGALIFRGFHHKTP